MRYVQHKSNNRVLGAPAGWDQKELPCGALPITDTVVEGKPAFMSYWKPSAEELKVLNRGGLICLGILSVATSPVWLAVEAE